MAAVTSRENRESFFHTLNLESLSLLPLSLFWAKIGSGTEVGIGKNLA